MVPDLTYAGQKTIEFFIGSPKVKDRQAKKKLRTFEQRKITKSFELENSIKDKQFQQLQSHILKLQKQVTTKDQQCLELIQKQQESLSAVEKLRNCEEIINKRIDQQSLLLEKAIAENVKQIITNLPHNSPLRRPLLSALTKGISQGDAQNYFSMSKRAYKRLTDGDESFLYNIKYKLNVKRNRLHSEAMTLLEELADEKVIKLVYYVK